MHSSITQPKSIATLIMSLSILLSLSCGKVSSNSVTAIDGIIDLSTTDISKSTVTLAGKWDFFWMKFISPAPQGAIIPPPDAYADIPDPWNKMLIGKDTLDGNGYASYRLKIVTKEKGLVGISVPDISGAYRLWANGELIASAGIPGMSPRESIPSPVHRTAYFYSDANPITLVMHVSNYQHAKGGMWKAPIFGSSAAIHAAQGRAMSLQILESGGLAVLTLSFLIFFFFRRDEKFILILAVLCSTVAIRTIANGGALFTSQDPIFPWWIYSKLKYIASVIAALLFTRYLSAVFKELLPQRIHYYTKILTWAGGALSIFTLLAPTTAYTSATLLYALYFLSCIILSVFQLKKAIDTTHRGAPAFIGGFSLICIALSNDLLYNSNLIDTAEVTPAAVLIFAVIQSVILALNYSHAFRDVELLSRQLKANNTMIKKLNEQIDHKNKEMTQRLYTDRLTGLPNRQSLFVDIHATAFPSLLLLDIDSFKEINDFYGNRIGDFVLREAAVILEKIINPETSKLYKLSVDEYAILIDDESIDSRALSYLSNSLCQEVSRRAIIHGKNEIFIRITIGAALGSMIEGKKTFEDIIVRADMALKQAKRFAKPFLLYNDSMEIIKEYEKNMHWARKLKMAVESDRIIPYYQPIINTATGAIEKFECLIRLTDDDGTIISPFHFLEIARKCRLYTELTKIMVDKAFATFKNSPYEFSLNISMDDILDTETREYIIGVLQMNREAASRSIFEILESQDIENYSEVKEFLSHVKSFGSRIAVDDFGSGYSNFEHIMRLNVDFIKIDASLVKNIHVDKNSRVIVKTISVFAKELGIKTVAEFVHCEEVLASIREIGIDYAQGYHLGEPKSSIV